jgi:hypothetical protein
MARLPRWEVTFLKAKDGSDPFPAFVSSLSAPAQVEWETLTRLLQKYGDSLQGNRVLLHPNELHEFQGDEVRIFYKRGPLTNQILVTAGLRVTDEQSFQNP